ncbi:MAG: hypothetical protein PHS73_04695 [Candidatus Peribacteraceae bacterium]|nr:hypothetical protein [Candidatus Peribacteraceae bacterium]
MPQSLEERFLDQVRNLRRGDHQALQAAADTLCSIRAHTGAISKQLKDACACHNLLRQIAEGDVDDVTDRDAGESFIGASADLADK